jgi:DNA-binding LacI/PurR family transcriptional regulator
LPDKITLQEIARLAKLSPATVSRVLNKTATVSQEAERRVRSALAKLGASQQRSNRTHVLCFLLANRPMLHPFHANVLMGAQAFAAEKGSHILFYPFQYAASAPPDDIMLPVLFERPGLVDGYIVGGMNAPNLLNYLQRAGLPFSVLGNNVLGDWRPEELDVVWIDDVNGGYELTRYLIGLGHRAIWFLGSRRFPERRIFEGYRSAMQESGLEPQSVQSDSDDEREAGYIEFKALLSRGVRPTAVFAHSDAVAHGAMDAALSVGLKVPEDLSIAGFGNRPEAAALSPSLTTAWGYPEQAGRRLAELALNRIATPDAPPVTVTVPTKLVKRESCAKAFEQAVAGLREKSM